MTHTRLSVEILSLEPHLTLGNASYHCFLQLVSEGRKEDKMSVYQKAMMYCGYL